MLKRLLALSLLPFYVQAEELPAPVQTIEKQGITIIKSFDAPGGMKGYLGKYQDMGVTIYVTPDGKQAISGYMYDTAGTNLSEKMIQDEIYSPAGRALWQQMEKSTWILDGKKDAPRVIYVLPILSARTAAGSGNSHVPGLRPVKYKSALYWLGSSNPKVRLRRRPILGDSDPAKKWHDYEQSLGKMTLDLPKTIPPTIMNVLKSNQTLMDELGANATPAIYYMNKDNVLQQEVGLPDEEKLKLIFGE